MLYMISTSQFTLQESLLKHTLTRRVSSIADSGLPWHGLWCSSLGGGRPHKTGKAASDGRRRVACSPRASTNTLPPLRSRRTPWPSSGRLRAVHGRENPCPLLPDSACDSFVIKPKCVRECPVFASVCYYTKKCVRECPVFAKALSYKGAPAPSHHKAPCRKSQHSSSSTFTTTRSCMCSGACAASEACAACAGSSRRTSSAASRCSRPRTR
jgi:hypothetical protein